MTAIAAIFNRDGSPVPRDDIERVTRALTPYGRDFHRAARFGEAALGCALASFTPEDVGKPQPVIGGGGRYALLFEGRIDNRGEVGAALGLDAAGLSRLSDAQLAMHSWERWGEEALLKWVAEFGLILWDEEARHLILARDPLGRLGLVYHETPRRFVAATMPAGLHALPDVPREIDELRIADSLSHIMTETRRTFFKDISALPAGHLMTVTRERATLRQYYSLREHIRPIRYGRDEDYVEAAREIFTTAVKSCLRASGDIGAFMSGGLDSSTGAVTASALLEAEGKRLPVFTWVPQDDWDGRVLAGLYGDETPHVRAIAERFPNLELTLVSAKGRTHYHRQDEYLRLSGLPMRNATAMGWFHSILDDARQRGIKVMLGGELGNMTLSHGGYGAFRELWKSGRFVQLARELHCREPGLRGMAHGFYTHIFSRLLSARSWERIQKARGRPGLTERWLHYSPIKRDWGEAMGMPQRGRDSNFDWWGRAYDADRAFWIWSMEQVQGNFGQWLPANVAMHGIEMRDPFNDRRLVEWGFGVPETQYYRNGTPRWLIKRMMRGALPDSVLFKKEQVGLGMSDWHARQKHEIGRMKADVALMREDPDLARMVDLERIEGWLHDWPEGTVVDANDPRRLALMVYLPMALQSARFVQLVKGANR